MVYFVTVLWVIVLRSIFKSIFYGFHLWCQEVEVKVLKLYVRLQECFSKAQQLKFKFKFDFDFLFTMLFFEDW